MIYRTPAVPEDPPRPFLCKLGFHSWRHVEVREEHDPSLLFIILEVCTCCPATRTYAEHPEFPG